MGADPVADHAVYVLGWLAAHDRDTFTARDLYTANRYRFPTADDLVPVLAHLERSAGSARNRNEADGPGPPPSPDWEINPTNRQQKQHKPPPD